MMVTTAGHGARYPVAQPQGTGSGWSMAVSASSTMASVQASGATDTGRPVTSTCSGSSPAVVRCAASQRSQACAPAVSPLAASDSAKNAVEGVQAVVRLPCQSIQASPAAGQAGEMAYVRTAGGAPCDRRAAARAVGARPLLAAVGHGG